MAITITKQQPAVQKPKKPTAQQLQEQTEQQMLVDELIGLELKLQAIDAAGIAKRMTAIKAQLQSIAVDAPPEEQVVLKGNLGQAVLSARSRGTEIENMETLVQYATDKVGKDAIHAVMKITLTDLKKLLSEGEIEKFSKPVWGSRSCKIVPN